MILARNWPSDGIPVVIEHAEDFPFEPGERARDWHPATDAEYQAYREYYDKDGDN